MDALYDVLQGSFKEICDFVEKEYESQLNWKLERCVHAASGPPAHKRLSLTLSLSHHLSLSLSCRSDQRKSPVWKSSVRKILFSNMRFRKHPEDKGLFCLAA